MDGESSVAFGVGHDEKNHVAADGSQSEEQGPGVPVFKEGESGEAYHRPHAKQGDRFHAPSHPFPRLVTPQVGAEPTGTVQGVVQFNPLFGLNAPVLIDGEEGVFINDALNKGLSGFFFPYVIARHDHATTAERHASDPKHLMGNGAYIYLAYKDGTAPLRYVLFAWRSCKKNPLKFFPMLRHVLQGVKYIKKNHIPD